MHETSDPSGDTSRHERDAIGDLARVLGAQLADALARIVEQQVAETLASMAPDEEERLLSAPEAADLLGMTTAGVRDLIRTGRITSVKIGRLRRIPSSAVKALMEGASQSGPAAETDPDRAGVRLPLSRGTAN